MFIILMGVSGCGKTTVGKQLAAALDWRFYDADDFHSSTAIEKMAAGVALTDADRLPWLKRLRGLIDDGLGRDLPSILACSALKKSYRDILTTGNNAIIIYLKADHSLIEKRLAARQNHFMPAALLHSQFSTLEEPKGVITIPAVWIPDRIVQHICSLLPNYQINRIILIDNDLPT